MPKGKSLKDTMKIINKKFGDKTLVNGSVNQIITERIIVQSTDNPNLGFSDIGDIVTSTKYNIPLIRSGFKKYSSTGTHIALDKPIYIFQNVNNSWQEL
jgi:hypothetical protein